MNSPLEKYKTVLEIGCGSGLSTLFLIQNGNYVISIDENIECLKKTKKLLSENNIKSRIIKREILFKENKNSYMYNFSKIMVEIDESEILLIEGDICGDKNLGIWLGEIKIDCIVTWLMGSHGARSMNKIIAEKNIKSPKDYRFMVQNKVYEIADKILDKGGILSIVDRCRTPKDILEKRSFIDFLMIKQV